MRAFEYASPKAKEQAVKLLGASWGESEILAGGTGLLALMKDDVVLPKRLVNIKDLADLRGIRFTPQNGLRIGALTTIAEVAEAATVKQNYPALASAALIAFAGLETQRHSPFGRYVRLHSRPPRFTPCAPPMIDEDSRIWPYEEPRRAFGDGGKAMGSFSCDWLTIARNCRNP